jgi:hypothetical protein
LNFLKPNGTARKFRLCAVAFCRSILHVLETHGPEVERIVAVAERFADGLATEEELQTTYYDINPFDYENAEAIDTCERDAHTAALHTVRLTTDVVVNPGARRLQYLRREKANRRAKVTHSAMLCDLIRDIFGPLLFRSVERDPHWLSWNDATIPKLAQAIYEERAFDRMPILADALEEAGCTNQDILTHCRSGDEHVRGCWVVDLVLGKS